MKRKQNSTYSYETDKDIYSNSKRGQHSKHAKKGKKAVVITLISIVAVLGIVASAVAFYINDKLNEIDRGQLDVSDLGISSDVFQEKVTNIALFGVDSRSDSISGRSDAIIVLTIDRVNNKIKMTSIARDSYVTMERKSGTMKDKITHAYSYASDGGPQLAVKTLNQNFDLDIQDYVSVNFFGFTEIIDYIGGVEIDVDADEMYVMNTEYVWHMNAMGIDCDYITKTGLQKLTGSQAVAYARNRYTGNDVDRGNRQKEILQAAYNKVKTLSVSELNKLVTLVLSNCETSLSNSEIIGLGTWAVAKSPTIENLSLPDKDCNPKSGVAATINGVWYYIYDLDIATRKIHDFINETGEFAPITSSVPDTSSVIQ